MPKSDKSKKNGSSRQPKENVSADTIVLSSNVEGTSYGQVIKVLGDCNFTVLCFDGRERLCHVRKSTKRKQKGNRAENDSIVLVGLRDYQDEKGDIIYIYTKEQVSILKRMHEIPTVTSSNPDTMDDDDNDNDEDNGFVFDEI
jgi:translation initiation factor 1A